MVLHAPTLAHVTAHEHRPLNRTLAAALFVVIYAMAGSYAVRTAGEPYAAALKEQELLDALKNERKANATLAATTAPDTADLSAKAGGAPPTPKATPSPTPPAGSYDPFDDEVLFDEDGFVKRAEDEPVSDTSAGTATNSTADDDEKDPNERPLPHEWLPSAGACVALFLAATAHALFYLMLRWSIDFKVRVFFAPSRRVVAGSYICFKPLPNKGKPALERVCRSARSDKLMVEFQRQKYEVLSAAAARAADGGADLIGPDTADAAVVLIPSPVALPCAEYAKASGLSSKDDVATRTELYGPNILSVRTPRFVDMYVEQLLSPLVIFQVTARRVSPAHSSVHVSAHISAHISTADLLLVPMAARRGLPRVHRLPARLDPTPRVDLRLPAAAHVQDPQRDERKADAAAGERIIAARPSASPANPAAVCSAAVWSRAVSHTPT